MTIFVVGNLAATQIDKHSETLSLTNFHVVARQGSQIPFNNEKDQNHEKITTQGYRGG